MRALVQYLQNVIEAKDGVIELMAAEIRLKNQAVERLVRQQGAIERQIGQI
jgi:hypothetical protein